MDRNRKAPEYCSRVLAKFGRNPWGEPIFRVVWSEAVFKTVGGEFHDGFRVRREYRQVPKYRAVARWVLEMWKPTPVSPERWARDEYDPISGLLRSGPYPYKGEYWPTMVIEGTPSKQKIRGSSHGGEYIPLSPGIVRYIANLVDKSQSVTPYQAFLAQREVEEQRQLAAQKLRRDIVSDAISAFCSAAYSGKYGKSKEKTKSFLGQPVKMAPFGQIPAEFLIDPTRKPN